MGLEALSSLPFEVFIVFRVGIIFPLCGGQVVLVEPKSTRTVPRLDVPPYLSLSSAPGPRDPGDTPTVKRVSTSVSYTVIVVEVRVPGSLRLCS